MAKPYRRRKTKGGPFVGNWRVTVDGRDINLGTKNATEALARAKLAAKGQWPPDEAAARAAVTMLDPGTPTPLVPPLVAVDPDVPAPTPPPESPEAPPVSLPPPGPAAPGPAPEQPGPTDPLEAATAAAAAEAGGLGEDVTADKAEREKASEQELAALMGELTGPGGQGEIVESLADGLAAGILWLERKSVELGWGWTFRKPTGKRLVTKPHDPAGIERKCIRVGMKAVLTIHFPELAAKLTPGWAIGIGCLMGGVACVASADLVDEDTGKVTAAADALRAMSTPGNSAPNPTPPPAA